MILTKDHNHGDYEIRSYEAGRLKINETYYESSVIVGPHQLILWDPQNLQELSQASFETILAIKPEIVLLGTGKIMTFPRPDLLKVFYEQQIGVEIMSTSAACRTFNVLMSESRNVVAGLLIR